MYTTNEHRLQIFAGKLILFFGESTFLTKKTEGALQNAGIISLGPVETVDQALKALESRTIDAVILDVALDANLVIPSGTGSGAQFSAVINTALFQKAE